MEMYGDGVQNFRAIPNDESNPFFLVSFFAPFSMARVLLETILCSTPNTNSIVEHY